MSTDKKCAHPACSCPPTKEFGNYCSESCSDAKDLLELACQCQHAGCQGEALR